MKDKSVKGKRLSLANSAIISACVGQGSYFFVTCIALLVFLPYNAVYPNQGVLFALWTSPIGALIGSLRGIHLYQKRAAIESSTAIGWVFGATIVALCLFPFILALIFCILQALGSIIGTLTGNKFTGNYNS